MIWFIKFIYFLFSTLNNASDTEEELRSYDENMLKLAAQTENEQIQCEDVELTEIGDDSKPIEEGNSEENTDKNDDSVIKNSNSSDR